MKKTHFLFGFVFFFAAALSAQEAAIVNKTSGKVLIVNAEGEKIQARKGMEVKEGFTVKTEQKARCELLFPDGTINFISEKTDFKVEKVHYSSESRDFSFNFLKGKILFFVNKIKSKANSYRVMTPTAVCAVRGTEFSAIASPSESSVGLFEGSVELEKDGEKREIKPGQEASISSHITVSEHFSAVMEKERVRAEKLRKYVENVRAKLQKREDSIKEKREKQNKKLNDFYGERNNKPEKASVGVSTN